MKEGWEYSTIGKICKTYSGGTPLKNVKEYYQNGNIPWLRSGEVCKKYIFETELFITQKGLENSSAKYYPIDTVVVAMYGATAAQVGILKIEATSNQAVCGILPNSKFLPEFLYYFFCYRKEFLASQAQGGAQPNISQVKIKNLEIPVPPLSEQQSIVDYLDSAFAKIDAMKANAEKALNEAKALFQASLKEMLEPKEGWLKDDLIKVFNFIDYRGATPTKLDSGVPLVTAKNVKYGYIDYTIKDYISKEEYESRKSRGISHKGDILFTTEAPLGNVAIANLDEFSAGQRLITLQQYEKPRYNFVNDFYYYYMLGPSFQKRIKELATGATALGIKAKLLKTVVVPIPPLSEQQSIVETLDSLKSKVDRLQANFDKISLECDALKQAILRQVFE